MPQFFKDDEELSGLLDPGTREGVLSDDSLEIMLRPEFEPGVINRVAPLRERQAGFLTETFDIDFEKSKKAVEIAEVFFPPLGIANIAHDAGMLLGEAIIDKSLTKGTLGAGLLTMAVIPGVPSSAKKTVTTAASKIAVSVQDTLAAFPEIGKGEFNKAFTAVLQSKNIQPSDLPKEMISDISSIANQVLVKIEDASGSIIDAAGLEKSGSEMQNILANFKNITDAISSINKPVILPGILQIEGVVSKNVTSKFSGKDLDTIAEEVQSLIKEHGNIGDAIELAEFDGKFGSEVHDTLVDLFNQSLPGSSLAKSATIKLEGISADEIGDVVVSVADDISTGAVNAFTQDAAELLEASDFDIVAAVKLAEGFKDPTVLKTLKKLAKDKNVLLPGAVKALTNKELTADFNKKVMQNFKDTHPSNQFSDMFDAAIITNKDPDIPTSDVYEITQEAIDILIADQYNLTTAIKTAGGLKSPAVANTLKELGTIKGFIPFGKKVIQDPTTIKRIPPTTSEHAEQLVSDIQVGIQAIDLPDAAKVDKFLERKGFSTDVLKRRSKLVFDEDMKDLFELKEAVFEGNVNNVMSQIAQRDVGRVLRVMPKGSVERKDFIDKLIRRKEGGFDLLAWHATTKELAKDLIKSGEFKLEMVGSNFGTAREPAIFLSPSPESAAPFGSMIFPLVLRSKNPLIMDMKKLRGRITDFSVDLTEEIIQAAKLADKDVVIIKNINDSGGLQDQILVLDTKLIRSIFADFKELDSANIGAGIAGASALPFAMKANNKDSDPES